MARVITPSGDEVRTVYSSGGFAAGDYVFQTASGFEKTTATTVFPLKATSIFNSSNTSSALGFGFTLASDYLLGPSQTGGAYTGSAISFGDNRFANTSIGVSSANTFSCTQLSNGNFIVAYDSSTSFKVRIYSRDFSTLVASFVYGVLPNLNQARLYPDNSGGCVVAGTNYSTGQLQVFYVANTSGNNYGVSNTTTFSAYVYETWPQSAGAGALSVDGIAYFCGRDTGSGPAYGFMCKYVYTPNSTATGTGYEAGFNLSTSIASSTIAITRTQLGSSGSYAYAIYRTGANDFRFVIDGNGATSRGSASFSYQFATGVALAYLGITTPYPVGSYGGIALPMISTNSIEIQVFYVDTYGFITSSGQFKTGGISLASSIGGNMAARTSIGATTSSSVLTSNPDLTVYYARTNGTYQSPYARLITGALSSGVTPTSSAEVSLNSSTATFDPEGPIASFSPMSGLLQGIGTVWPNLTMQGSAAGTLSTPQSIVYGSSLTPAQTGTCVGVALTAASAGGTGKILVRGTAEVRSTLPNMPGALSFNHANYGTPGGIRGSVAGRTVTFEGIDG